MAINDAVPGIDIAVTVDDLPLQEHIEADVEEEAKTVTRYVEAKSNQNFKVRINVDRGTRMKGNCLSFNMYVDGKRVARPFVTPDQIENSSYTRTIEGYSPSPNALHRFRFDSLEKASDGKIFDAEVALVKKIGTIEVFVKDKNKLRKSEKRSADTPSGVGIVSEKALKGRALSHSVAFDAPSARNGSRNAWVTELVDKNEPFAAKMVFKYRSLESLKAEMIIPRTPSPPPIEEKEDLTQEEMRELQRQNRELKASALKIKRERGEESTPISNKRVCHRPAAGDTHVAIEESGAREMSTAHLPPRQQPEVVEISSDEED